MARRDPDPRLNDTPFKTTEFHGMPYVQVGASGLRASRVGVGTFKFGYPDSGDGSRSDEATSLAILDACWEAGATFWDTANRYNGGSGNSERIIGTWLENNPDKRRDIVVATKTYNGMNGITPNHGGLSRLQIIESVKASLERLGLEWFDMLWFHRYDDEIPVEESLETVEDLVERGLVHYLGVSNYTVPQLEQYLDVAGRLSRRARPIAVQNKFDVLHGESLPGVLEFCAAEGLGFTPWAPLAKGLLTDRYLEPKQIGAGDRLHDEGDEVSDADLAKVRRLAELAREWGTTTSVLALAYTTTLAGMGPQIPSSSTPEQAVLNASAGKLDLNAEQRAELDALFA
ncbi:MAG TPA: aldo/keto reductase [Propionibacteriaceae bacterium]|nr:aldo/keto reductase [Propionibacteriaceae bacterium]HPZ48595.1 aldo/keto reductase [Propionibacteriaceae bacterium]HQE31179.1 aldo/keto reductase [Propionibacteriaceae bacterium]